MPRGHHVMFGQECRYMSSELWVCTVGKVFGLLLQGALRSFLQPTTQSLYMGRSRELYLRMIRRFQQIPEKISKHILATYSTASYSFDTFAVTPAKRQSAEHQIHQAMIISAPLNAFTVTLSLRVASHLI